jgi:hypothetical protein
LEENQSKVLYEYAFGIFFVFCFLSSDLDGSGTNIDPSPASELLTRVSRSLLQPPFADKGIDQESTKVIDRISRRQPYQSEFYQLINME